MKRPTFSLALVAAIAGSAFALATASAQQFTQEQLARQKALYAQAQNDLARGDIVAAEAKTRELMRQRPRDPYMRQLLVRVEDAKRKAATTSPWEAKMKRLIVPSVNMDEATLEEVVHYVRTKGKELSGEPHGPNIILKGDIRDRLVTLNLSGMPLSEVLRLAGEVAGVKFVYGRHAIVGQVPTPSIAKPTPPTTKKPDPAPAADPFPAAVGYPAPPATRGVSL